MPTKNWHPRIFRPSYGPVIFLVELFEGVRRFSSHFYISLLMVQVLFLIRPPGSADFEQLCNIQVIGISFINEYCGGKYIQLALFIITVQQPPLFFLSEGATKYVSSREPLGLLIFSISQKSRKKIILFKKKCSVVELGSPKIGILQRP